MTKYLIYKGEGQEFIVDDAIDRITRIDGVRSAETGNFIGAVFQCLFEGSADIPNIVRISESLETITFDGSLDDFTTFGWLLQETFEDDLRFTDMDLSIDHSFAEFENREDFWVTMRQSQ